MDFLHWDDFYLKMVANIAFGDKIGDKVPIANGEEMDIFKRARRHFSPAVFDETRWKKAVGNDEDLWRRTVYVLNCGGCFEDASKAYNGDKVAHQFKSQFNLSVEHVALGKQSLSGENFSGIPIAEPVRDAAGKEVRFGGDFPFQLFTYKLILGGQSRTIGNYWTMVAEQGQNYFYLNGCSCEKGQEAGPSPDGRQSEKAASVGEGADADALVRQADEVFKAAQYEKAVSLYKSALEKVP
ncbi:MAG: hypothetical protein ACUVQ6_03230 [Dissulfurimicrobium sp.]|uniref:hypothetical protein n=1 Tax=Dissulfurimicrobium sp. TaxID=2022436 RepID=UPI004049C731